MRLSWNVVVPIWCSFVWRAMVYGLLTSATAGFVVGVLSWSTGRIAEASLWAFQAGTIAGWLASLPALKHGLKRHLHRLTAESASPLSGQAR